ncbi:family 1 glycosylhydrolase [Nocardia pseudobrasiliensis]|uniref:Glycosyl hydrolase family 1 n=1 Tax=Nocardia pseudobrasiliensis TaxID=45979 RepID=A0A370HYF6_9NOCA|nr:family 1 glycosylhydrolase [Nocardia pseudobrasiliensis]RDI63546.1 glycosyl hydrolase family 1 [Nocardia pseudobrasiliensis]
MRPIRRREALALAAAATLLTPPARALARPAPPATVAPVSAGFLWGVASAGFQCEGVAPDSNWRRYVDTNPDYDRYGQAVDFYHRYPADIAAAANLGAGVYRISVEWARVQPRPEAWEEAGFAFYDAVLDAIAAAGMRPMLTLDHWVYPGWAVERGGWADPGMPEAWLANARRVVDRYAGRDPLWVSFNEPTFYVLNETTNGGLSPAAAPLMVAGIIRAHNEIYDHIHRVQPGARVTSNLAYVAGTVEPVLNGPILDGIAARLDYVGIDYYYGFTPQTILRTSPADLKALWAMPLQPEGIYYALGHYARRFPGKPLYVVENGMPTRDGAPRADGYTRAQDLRDSVYWIQRALADGMPVLGYNYWSITDNYEWGSYTPRFGLYTVDVRTDATLTRRPTDAVAAYTELIGARGVAPDYRPTRAPAQCSLVDAPDSCLDPVTVPAHR